MRWNKRKKNGGWWKIYWKWLRIPSLQDSTNLTASMVVICSITTFSCGSLWTKGFKTVSIKTFSRSKTSTSVSVTSPWTCEQRNAHIQKGILYANQCLLQMFYQEQECLLQMVNITRKFFCNVLHKSLYDLLSLCNALSSFTHSSRRSSKLTKNLKLRPVKCDDAYYIWTS